jgi:hypothetical protein
MVRHSQLKIVLKRKADGSAALTCTRADGSVTWQRQEGSMGAVFPEHDLTHYAVETELSYRKGFFGLLSEGWNISDFAKPWPRGPVPAEALQVELVVGVLTMEMRMNAVWSATELLEQGDLYASARESRGGISMPRLRDEQLDRIRSKRADLFDRWSRVQSGETLDLVFDPATGED